MVPGKWRILEWRGAALGERFLRQRNDHVITTGQTRVAGPVIGRRHGDDMDYNMQAIGDNALVFPFCPPKAVVAVRVHLAVGVVTGAHLFEGCVWCESKCTAVVWPMAGRTRRPFASASAVAARFVGNALDSDSKALVAWGGERERLESCCRSLIHPWTACDRVQRRIDVFSLAGPPLDPPFYQDARITCQARDALSRVEYESHPVIGPKLCLHC
ncbi:hypothetical protein SVAN01_04656 [Stagonosporopsis vannaccii]|nr:hypothetical protein SVAN01_04656 [Stagonosporopsis vannaccii]